MKLGSKALALALLFVGLVLVNYLASSLPVRLDATADSIYSLSPGTKAILGKIEEPVVLDLYFSKDASGVPISYKNYAARVQEMLRQYVRASHGKLTLKVINPKPDTPEEEKATAAGLAPETPVQLLPGFSAYVGADIVAGVFASGMVFDPTPSLLVDIGTNGEIVLQSGGKLTACATAAGPAFEGCGLRCGTRARVGAVSDLFLNLDPLILCTEVIGSVPLARANGICGSAYVDFLATARSCGLLGVAGRFQATVWENIPIQNRLTDDGERALRLTDASGAGALRISEVDVALLLQAKAAIGAGIEILLETAGLHASDLGRVYLAGGFGMHLNVAHAIAIGLLPGFRGEQVRVVGNTSLAGALLALVDRTTLDEMENLRTQMEVIELNLAADFEDRYIEHLTLP